MIKWLNTFKKVYFFFLSEYLEVSINCLDETEGKIRSFYIFFYENDAHLLLIYLNGEEQQCGTSRMPDDHKVMMLANNLDAIYLSSFTFSVIFCFSARYD